MGETHAKILPRISKTWLQASRMPSSWCPTINVSLLAKNDSSRAPVGTLYAPSVEILTQLKPALSRATQVLVVNEAIQVEEAQAATQRLRLALDGFSLRALRFAYSGHWDQDVGAWIGTCCRRVEHLVVTKNPLAEPNVNSVHLDAVLEALPNLMTVGCVIDKPAELKELAVSSRAQRLLYFLRVDGAGRSSILNEAFLWGNEDWAYLSKLTALEKVVYGNGVYVLQDSDLAPLQSLTKLTSLELPTRSLVRGSGLADLATLPSLEHLHLGASMSSRHIKTLASFPALVHLSLHYLTQHDINALIARCPNLLRRLVKLSISAVSTDLGVDDLSLFLRQLVSLEYLKIERAADGQVSAFDACCNLGRLARLVLPKALQPNGPSTLVESLLRALPKLVIDLI